VARVTTCGRNRILRTEATRTHGKQERDTKRSIPYRAHTQHLGRWPSAHRSRRPIYPPATPLTMTMKSVNKHKRSAPRDHLQHRRKLSMPSPQRPSNPPSTHPTPSPGRASTAGMQNKDVPRPTLTTHGHQLYRKLVRRPRSPSVLNLLLVTGFNPAWFGHYGFLEDEEACPPSGKGASSVCTIWLVQGEKTTGLVRRWFA
jgi:hypothetical protein